ncbi:MAG: acetyl-CoA carboxylase biotin carboxyl carrier protein [Clostridia bacterium]|nr:acetyl-CoA carboxylase biotin carboxyl carrier protein [Clostridia bacterium]
MDKLDASKTDSLELEVADVKIKLGKHTPPPCEPHHGAPSPQPAMMPAVPVSAPAAPQIAPEAASASAPAATVNAPLLGVAYAASSPEAEPFIKVGDKVKKGDIICIIEAMKVMNEIESDKDGEVTEILFENGKMVEFGQPLISVK